MSVVFFSWSRSQRKVWSLPEKRVESVQNEEPGDDDTLKTWATTMENQNQTIVSSRNGSTVSSESHQHLQEVRAQSSAVQVNRALLNVLSS